MTEMHVLGVDLASGRWADNGAAMLSFDADERRWTGLRVPALKWPACNLTPSAMASAIDTFVRSNRISAVALDGPQGWRDPATPPGTPGVGRRCELLCQTQGKTGVEGKTFPQTQYGWIKFCIEVFDELLRLGHARIASGPSPLSLASSAYWLIECFPTWTWKESGLVALPGKSKHPDTLPYWNLLQQTYALPSHSAPIGHDDLQGVVAALTAAAVLNGPCSSTSYGAPAFLGTSASGASLRLEGLIWSAQPLLETSTTAAAIIPTVVALEESRLLHAVSETQVSLRVTQKVVDHVNRQGKSAEQIAITGNAVQKLDGLVALRVGDTEYSLIKRDTHAFWRSHQTPETLPSFEELFGQLADIPDDRVVGEIVSATGS
jgi:hypothetical protein